MTITGALVAISLFAKLYPLYALIILAAFFIREHPEKKRLLQSFTLTSVCIFLLSPLLWLEYLIDVLPGWTSEKTAIFNLAHSFKSIPLPFVGTAMYFVCLLFWALASSKASEKRIGWVWAGGLAISTFNNGVSFDYNLVTLFPLAILGFNYLSKNENKFLGVCFSLLFFTVFGSRELLVNFSAYPLIRLFIMGFSLAAIPFLYFDLGHEFKRVRSQIKFRLVNKFN
jgi:hypothetical protein